MNPTLLDSELDDSRFKRGTTSLNPVTEGQHEYIHGIKIYGIGIKDDPVPGEKRGKGIQHLTSSYWIYDMGVFIQRNFKCLQTMAKYAHDRSTAEESTFDFRYYINVSNALFLKAEAEGLATRDGRDFFLMACWLAMAAAEVDGFSYGKYSPEQRKEHRAAFYRKYLSPNVVWDDSEEDDLEIEESLGKYAIEGCRIDLLPSVALERLGLHNELCGLKWAGYANKWMREGFVVSARFDSMKRHYESVHAEDRSEDHLAHLIWGFMALTHVIAVFPQMNDLTNFEETRRNNVVEAHDPSLAALVGDGAFRSASKSRQSSMPLLKPSLPSKEGVNLTRHFTGRSFLFDRHDSERKSKEAGLRDESSSDTQQQSKGEERVFSATKPPES